MVNVHTLMKTKVERPQYIVLIKNVVILTFCVVSLTCQIIY